MSAIYKDIVGERFLRCSIGFSWHETFNPILHGEIDTVEDYWNNEVVLAEDRVYWLYSLVSLFDRDERPR